MASGLLSVAAGLLLCCSAQTVRAGADTLRVGGPVCPAVQAPVRSVRPDSVDSARLERNYFWRAAAEVAGLNVGLWAFDRYVQRGHFAYISWNTMKDNLRHGFDWDDDHLSTNMFAHPYNGSLFYNAARSNGYNFWQSELFAIGGSAMWELFMECEYPSTNDIIATPVGGAALGEVLYRTSDLLLDDRVRGGRRFGRELAAFLVSPMRGLTRIVTGRAWEVRSTSGRRFGLPPIRMNLAMGTRVLMYHGDGRVQKAGAFLHWDVAYGDRYAERTTAPFDYFTFLLELNAMDTQPLLSRVEIVGRLLSRRIVDSRRCDLTVGLYQHFDFFDSDTISRSPSGKVLQPCLVPYKLGTPASVGGGLMFRYADRPKWQLDAYAHVNGVLLGGILSDYYRFYHRNYNWSSGFSLKVGAECLLWKERLTVSVANQFYRLYSWNGWNPDVDWSLTPAGKPVDVQGDYSRAFFNHFEARLNWRLGRRLGLAIGADGYRRNTWYNHYMSFPEEGFSLSNPILDSRQWSLSLLLNYVF